MSGIIVKHVTAHKTGQWWVVNTSPAATADTVTQYTVVQGTQNDALNLPDGGGISGPYSSQAAADKVANAEPQNKNVSVFPGVNVTPGGRVAGPLSGLAAIGDFFQRMTQAKFWERAGEIVLGIILISIGLARLTRAVPIATAIAKKAGMAAVAA